MNINRLYIAVSIIIGALIFISTNHAYSNTNNTKENTSIKSLAIKGLDALFKNYDVAAVRKYFREDYIQHNPYVPTGLDPITKLLPTLKKTAIQYTNHRLIQDGEFVVMHNTYINAEAFGAKDIVTFDIWRMQDDKIAEHWDATASIVKQTTSGRKQYDGPTQVVDIAKTAANKALVKNLMEDVFLGKAPEKISDYISSEQYHQHNPDIKDGLAGLQAAMSELAAQNNMFEYHKIHRILGEGNFVLTQSEGRWHGKPQAFYDLFRIQDGKIVEHWDVVQEIPEKIAHNNSMF